VDGAPFMNWPPQENYPTEEPHRLQGDLSLMPVLDLLKWIDSRGQSGALSLVNGVTRKTLAIEQGMLVGLVTNRKEESQEHILAGAGFIGAEQLATAQRQSRELGMSLSRFLVERKFLDPQALKRLQTFRLLLALADVLRWETGFFSLQGTEQAPAGGRLVRLALGEALDHAQRLNEKALEEQRRYQKSQFQTISQRLLASNFTLPPMPKTLRQLQQAINDPKGSAHDVLKIVMADQVLTSRVLKVVNSSFYSLSNPVTSVQHAIVMLGFKPLLGIVTATSLESPTGLDQRGVVQLMRHSFKCAYVAKNLARTLGEDEEIAFVCGLLHDIGKTVLYRLLAEYELSDAVREQLVTAYHTQTGALLATRWHLPEPVAAAIESHHDPDCLTSGNPVAGIVFLANRLVNDGQLPVVAHSSFAGGLAALDLPRLGEELRQVEAFVDAIF